MCRRRRVPAVAVALSLAVGIGVAAAPVAGALPASTGTLTGALPDPTGSLTGQPVATTAGRPPAGSPMADAPSDDGWLPLPADYPVSFAFGLARDDAAAWADLVERATPGSDTFRQWLTLEQVAAAHGASAQTQAAVVAWFGARGMTVAIDAGATYAIVIGTPAQWQAVTGAIPMGRPNEEAQDLPGTSIGFDAATPRLPAEVSALLPEQPWVSADSRTIPVPPTPRSARTGLPLATPAPAPPAAKPKRPLPRNEGTWVGGCPRARQQGTAYSFGQVARAYDAVAGPAQVGVMTVSEGVDQASMTRAERCWGWPTRPVRFVLAPGQEAPAPLAFTGFSEAQLDAQVVRGLAPRATVVNYQSWGDMALWFLAAGAVVADRDRPPVLNLSYGLCLTDWPDMGRSLLDAQLVRLGLLGVTVVTPSGDDGSAVCAGDRPSVGYPAASPAMLTVGGTRLVVDERNRRVREVAWNDYPYVGGSFASGGSSGGGRATQYQRPDWQRGLVSGTGRAFPDVSAHASDLPGWPMINLLDSGVDVSTTGGTSASAPVVATQLAIAAARQIRAGQPSYGLVAPWLYAVHNGHPDRFFDVTQGTTRQPAGKGFRAGPGYDLATGLGVPVFGRLLR